MTISVSDELHEKLSQHCSSPSEVNELIEYLLQLGLALMGYYNSLHLDDFRSKLPSSGRGGLDEDKVVGSGDLG